MTARLRLALACTALLVLTACGAGASTTSSAGQAGGDAGRSSAASGPGATASALTADTLDGGAFDFATVSDRPTVLWFWAPWCTICRAEAPEIAAAVDRLGDDVRVLGVPGRGDEPDMRAFVEDTGVGGFDHVVDADGQIWSSYGVISQPAFAFIDTSGGVQVFNGSLRGEEFEQAARDLLG